MNAGIHQTLLKHEFIETAELDGEWVLLDLESHSITKLNDMGGYIWSLLDEHGTIERLTDKIAQEYDVEPERAASDVEAFVTQLVQVGLVTYG